MELGFYLVLPLLLFIIHKLKTRTKINLLFAAVYIGSVLWYFLLGKYYAELGIPSQLHYQLPGYMSFFVMGMAFLFNWDVLVRRLSALVVSCCCRFRFR